jgi:hypothetical protein
MNSFPGNYYGQRYSSGRKSGDIFNDYLNFTKRVAFDPSKITWRLHNFETSDEYQSWEFHMQRGFNRCRTYDSEFDGYVGFILAHRRVDVEVASWWSEKVDKEITYATWEDYMKFLRACFVSSSRMVPRRQTIINMEVIKQPPKVMHRLADVGKSIAHLPKPATVVTTLILMRS